MQEQFDVPLATLTTMHVGGPARRLVVAETIDEIVDVRAALKTEHGWVMDVYALSMPAS